MTDNAGQPAYDMSLQVTIPNEWEKMAPVNIGYTADLAVAIVRMMNQDQKELYGVYHLVNEGECTWYEVASEIADILGSGKDKVHPITTDDFYTNLKRPKDTSLNIYKIKNNFDIQVPHWRDALKRFFEEVN